jgi:integrase
MGGGMTRSERRRLPKYVIEYEVKGEPYVYFRKKGQKDIRMRGIPWSPEWLALYERLKAGELPPESEKLTPPKENTLAWLCQRYFDSTLFKALDPKTQRVRRQILQSCLDEPTQQNKPDGHKFGAMPLARFTAKGVATLRDRKADLPEAANGRVKAIRAVFKWACLSEVALSHVNPARDVSYRASSNPDGFHTWTLEEVEQYERRHPIGTKARLALALFLYTFQRRSDVHRIGAAHVKNGRLVFTQFKGRNKHPQHMELPILPELRTILEATETGDLVYLINDLGKPFTAAGLGNKMRQWCDQAELPQCSAHGLRKAACVRMAMNGATPHEIMAWSGHKTLKEVERYTREAEKRKLAMASMDKAGTGS